MAHGKRGRKKTILPGVGNRFIAEERGKGANLSLRREKKQYLENQRERTSYGRGKEGKAKAGFKTVLEGEEKKRGGVTCRRERGGKGEWGLLSFEKIRGKLTQHPSQEKEERGTLQIISLILKGGGGEKGVFRFSYFGGGGGKFV